MWVLHQSLLVAFVYFLPVLLDPTEDKLAAYYCNKLEYKYTAGFTRSTVTIQANTAFISCKTRFLTNIHTTGTLPSEGEIDKFVTICNDKIKMLVTCSNVFDHLSKHGYSIITATELLEEVSAKRPDLHLSKTFQEIYLSYSLRVELLGIDNLNIDRCILDFWVNTASKESTMRTFLSWWNTNNNKKKTYCNCEHVFGLQSIYDTRKENVVSVLHDYYENVCSENFPDKEKWNKDNLSCIGESKQPLNGATIKQFLTIGVPLTEANWCKYRKTFVPFDYLWPKLQSASAEEIKVISYAVSANFNGDHYKTFLQIMTTYGDNFVGKKCLDDITEAAFKREAPLKNYVWDFKAFKEASVYTSPPYDDEDHPFNKHIQILLELFLKTNSNSPTCENFTTYLSKFKSILVKRKFSDESLTTNLFEFIKKRTSIDNLIQCYQFTLDVEDKIYNVYKMLKDRSIDGKVDDHDFFGYRTQFMELRRMVFKKLPPELNQICKNEHPDYNINSQDGIWNLINSIFKNIDYKEGDLNDLFSKIVVGTISRSRSSLFR